MSLYDFTVNDLNGNSVSLSAYKGHVCVIVNVTQYANNADTYLRRLYMMMSTFKQKDVQLLLFPCSQFGPTDEINALSEFVNRHCPGVGVLFAPVDINGSTQSDVYKFLKSKTPGPISMVNKSYTTFITNKEGVPTVRANPGYSVDDLGDWIRSNLVETVKKSGGLKISNF